MQAKEDVEQRREAYLAADSVANREISLFEDWMTGDLKETIKSYVAANIAQERRKLHSMEKAFQKIKEGRSRKMSLNDVEDGDEEVPDQEERRRRYKQQYEAPLTLRTSSSLPSLNQGRKKAQGHTLYAQDAIEEEESYGNTSSSFDERHSVWTMNVPGRTGKHTIPFDEPAL